MRKLMSSTILTVATFASATLVQAKETESDYRHAPEIGLSTGVVIGSIVAGPAGAAVAGMIGAMVGNDVRQDKLLAAKEQRLTAQSELLSQRDQSLIAMRQKLEQLQQASVTRVAAIESRHAPSLTLQSSVQFQTGSHEIAPDYQQQLDLIARALKGYSSLRARLTGHADQRGDEKYNQALSMQRAINVKQYLLNQGVDEKQVLAIALGEEKSRYNDYESTFFDRKVVIELGEEDATLTAQR